MSFFSKLNNKLDGMKGAPSQGQGQGSGYPTQQPQFGALAPYGGTPSQYGSPAPSYPYNAQPAEHPPQQGATVPPMPWLPQGWAALWDPTGARWAYLNPEMVSRVSWTPPVVVEDPSRGFGNGGQWGYPAPALAAPPYGVPAPVNSSGAVKDNSKKGMMMGAAGVAVAGVAVAGVAVGALGGVALNHALGGDHYGGGEDYDNGGYGSD
ncbi:hypothetical protein B0J14DRAFT_274654 [Halenospora varia]|nr:hypothetical protein B0J14DRAFT_274654 [Halenospora varia]